MSKQKIRALILDYGGVLSQPQNPENINNIIQSLRQDHADFMKVYYAQRARYDSGHISGEQYWMNVLRHYGLDPLDFQLDHLIREDVKSWTRPNESMLGFLAENRGKVHKLAIISNMINDTLVFMRKNYAWLELFDELIFSCELGKNKPGAEIYETCLKKLELSPEDCLFVDDSAENVKGAQKLGMPAIHYKGFPEFLQELDENFWMAS
jgi:putative hydrolase of the HAD superfamily